MLAWKELARRYRYRYNRIVRLNKGAVAAVIEALKELSPFIEVIKDLLEIIDSELDRETAEHYSVVIQRAKGLIHGHTAGIRKAPTSKRGFESGSGY